MPTRILREGILTSSRINALSPLAELFYRRLMTVADDYGRYHASPGTLRGACWPTCPERVTEKQIVEWLDECSSGSRPLLGLYEVEGLRYLEILNFSQRTRSPSKFPAYSLENALLSICPSIDRQMSALGEGVGVGEGAGGPRAPKLTELQTGTFLRWWAVWSATRGTHHKAEALEAFSAQVNPANEQACFDCSASYLASLDDPARGYNPDKFLRRFAATGFIDRWPRSGQCNGKPPATGMMMTVTDAQYGWRPEDEERKAAVAKAGI